MRIFNQTRGVIMAERVLQARTFFRRLLGLQLLRQWSLGDGLYIAPCQWIHTLGLGYALDAVYIDTQGCIVAWETMKPWRIGSWVRRGAGVLELPAGTCERTGCQSGDRLSFDPAMNGS